MLNEISIDHSLFLRALLAHDLLSDVYAVTPREAYFTNIAQCPRTHTAFTGSTLTFRGRPFGFLGAEINAESSLMVLPRLTISS